MDQLARLDKKIRLLEKKLSLSEQQRQQLEQFHDRDRLLFKNLMERVELAHRELQNAQARLVQSEKMASLGKLTAGIAHEIKNPLNFVNNFAELSTELVAELEETLDQYPEALGAVAAILSDLRHNSETIARNGKRADGIVSTMMQHASSGSGEHVATEVNGLVSEYVELAYHGRPSQISTPGIEFKKELDEKVGVVELAPEDIGRVVLNLINNAVDAVTERAKTDKSHEPAVTVSTRRTDNTVEIVVADNGNGIPNDILPKIFEPFFTTKPTGTGTGLGLSLSYDIVTQGHQGTLSAESEDSVGATFVISLPA